MSTTVAGLSTAEAARRFASEGPNRLPAPRRPSAARRLAGELTHFFAVMLWVAGVLALVAGLPELGIAIFAVTNTVADRTASAPGPVPGTFVSSSSDDSIRWALVLDQLDAPPPPPASGVNAALGVRVFPHYSGTTYSNHEAVLDTLGRLGVDRVSGRLFPSMSTDEIAFYQQAHSRHGIKVWFAVGEPGVALTDAEWTSVRNLLTGPLAGIAAIASGWNEPNHQVAGDWSTVTADHQAKLWANIQQVNSASGQNIMVGTPPLWSGNLDTQFADLQVLAPKIQGKYNLVNWHMYPHGKSGAELAAMIDRQVSEFRAAYGSHPMLNSESGYFTATNYVGGSNPSTYESQAAEIDDLVNMHLARNVDLSYFELLDDPDPADSNREANFGLVETPSLSPSTWFDKPAFAVFRTQTD